MSDDSASAPAGGLFGYVLKPVGSGSDELRPFHVLPPGPGSLGGGAGGVGSSRGSSIADGSSSSPRAPPALTRASSSSSTGSAGSQGNSGNSSAASMNDFDVAVSIGRKDIKPSSKYVNFISRNHVTVGLKDGQLRLLCLVDDKVALNGKSVPSNQSVDLKAGDVVCLLLPKQQFNLEVATLDAASSADLTRVGSTPEAALARRRLSPMVPANKRQKTGASSSAALAAETGECPICLEHMALAQVGVPCGHSFCYTCICDWMKSSSSCPSCNHELRDTYPNIALDGIVRELLEKGGDADLLAKYDKKCEDARVVRNAAVAAPKPSAKPSSSSSSSSGSSSSIAGRSTASTTMPPPLPPSSAAASASLARNRRQAGSAVPPAGSVNIQDMFRARNAAVIDLS